MKDVTINIPFLATLTENPDGLCYISEPMGYNTEGVYCHAKSEGKAKAILKEKLKEKLKDLFNSEANNEQEVIFTGDGHVMIVSWKNGGYQYEMHSKLRNYPSSCIPANGATFESVLESALAHAEGSMEGVVWRSHSLR